MSYAIATGSPFDKGLTLIGPFEHKADAQAYAEGSGTTTPILNLWEVVEMQPITPDDINSTWAKDDASSAEAAASVFTDADPAIVYPTA